MRILLATTVAGVMLCGAAMAASAAPLPATPGVNTAVEKVHGYHRSCVRGHRNVRRGTVRCGRRYYRNRGPGFSLYIGPGYRSWRHRDWRSHRHGKRGNRHYGRRHHN